LPKFTIQNK